MSSFVLNRPATFPRGGVGDQPAASHPPKGARFQVISRTFPRAETLRCRAAAAENEVSQGSFRNGALVAPLAMG